MRKLTLSLLAAASVALPAQAHASTIPVAPGGSIQRAIDRAHPGDTVAVAAGVFHENLNVTKDRITLRGVAGSTVLEPPDTPAEGLCNEFGDVTGICVHGDIDAATNALGTPVSGTRISGIAVRRFTRFGVLIANAADTRISSDELTANDAYGLAAFWVSGIQLLGNASHDNHQGGFYIADSPHAGALVAGNRSYRNAGTEGFGLYVRDASSGVVRDNSANDDCTGILLVDGPLDGAAADWTVRDNAVRDNTAACPPSEDVPIPLSGSGIALLGTRGVLVDGNQVTGNRPTIDAPLAGGILLASAGDLGGPDPIGNVVQDNRARGNAPADLIYDGSGSGNRFAANVCGKSLPGGLCG